MRLMKFNELYEQQPKEFDASSNTFTFKCDITVRANSQEEAEDKMEFIANQDPDVELGFYELDASMVGGKGVLHGVKPFAGPLEEEPTISSELPARDVMEARKHRIPKRSRRR